MTIESFVFDARSLITVASFLSFIGIFLWAYSARRSADFEAAARLPLDDDTSLLSRNSLSKITEGSITAVEKRNG